VIFVKPAWVRASSFTLNKDQLKQDKNNRMAYFGGDLKNHLAPTPLPWTGLPPTTSDCPGPHPAWGWDIHSFSGQSLPVFHQPFEYFFLTSNLNLPSFSLKPFSLLLSLSDHVKCVYPSCLKAPFKYWKASVRSFRSFLISVLDEPDFFSLSL